MHMRCVITSGSLSVAPLQSGVDCGLPPLPSAAALIYLDRPHRRRYGDVSAFPHALHTIRPRARPSTAASLTPAPLVAVAPRCFAVCSVDANAGLLTNFEVLDHLRQSTSAASYTRTHRCQPLSSRDAQPKQQLTALPLLCSPLLMHSLPSWSAYQEQTAELKGPPRSAPPAPTPLGTAKAVHHRATSD